MEPEVLLSWFEICGIIIDYLLGSMLLVRTLKLAEGATKTYYTGITWFFYAHGTCRLLFLLRSNVFMGNDVLFDIGTILGVLAVVSIIYSIEKTIFRRSRMLFTVFGLACITIEIVDAFAQLRFFDYRLIVLAQYVAMVVLVPFIIILYVKALIKSTEDTKKNAVAMLISIFLLATSEVFYSSFAINILPIVQYIAPLLMVIALLFLYYAIMNLRVWKATGKAKSLEEDAGRDTNEGQ